MINVLIANRDFKFTIKLINGLNKVNSNIRICRVVSNEREVIKTINDLNENIDIVILNLNMSKENINELLKKVQYKGKYEKAFILVLEKSVDNFENLNNSLIDKVIYKSESLDKIVNNISKILKYKEKVENEYKIKKELLYLGYNMAYKGTRYLIETIEIFANRYEQDTCKLEKSVYPIIASKYQDSIHNIKCSIYRATDNMYYECEIPKLKKYFYLENDEKPKVKTIVETIANKII